MSVTPDGPSSPLDAGNRELGPYPSQGEKVDATTGGQHLKKMWDAIDALIRRLGLDSDTDGKAWEGFSTVGERFNNLPGAVTDHGALTGRADDDHNVGINAYLTNSRGDARYYSKTQLDGGQLDTQYFQKSEFREDTGAGGEPIKLNTVGGQGNIGRIRPELLPTKQVFFPVQDASGSFATFRTANIGQNADFDFNFIVPFDFQSVGTIHAVGIANANGGAGAIFNLESNYGNFLTGAHNDNNETDLTAFNLSAASGKFILVSLTTVLSSLVADHVVGVNIDHAAIGTTISYIGIRMTYLPGL